jgi:hypothetical protein
LVKKLKEIEEKVKGCIIKNSSKYSKHKKPPGTRINHLASG